jgi:hypothetical protein
LPLEDDSVPLKLADHVLHRLANQNVIVDHKDLHLPPVPLSPTKISQFHRRCIWRLREVEFSVAKQRESGVGTAARATRSGTALGAT